MFTLDASRRRDVQYNSPKVANHLPSTCSRSASGHLMHSAVQFHTIYMLLFSSSSTSTDDVQVVHEKGLFPVSGHSTSARRPPCSWPRHRIFHGVPSITVVGRSATGLREEKRDGVFTSKHVYSKWNFPRLSQELTALLFPSSMPLTMTRVLLPGVHSALSPAHLISASESSLSAHRRR